MFDNRYHFSGCTYKSFVSKQKKSSLFQKDRFLNFLGDNTGITQLSGTGYSGTYTLHICVDYIYGHSLCGVLFPIVEAPLVFS